METASLSNRNNLPIRLMFQDEARFGRVSDPSFCWAPAPLRLMVNLVLVREFKYEYAVVSPWDGVLDFMTADKMNTENMSQFVQQISEAHSNDFNIMVVDGASSHKSKDLKIPDNVSLVLLPPYYPHFVCPFLEYYFKFRC